ncbi:MAG: GNAT family N-acetyltransferase [Promethearchaeota archaeon]
MIHYKCLENIDESDILNTHNSAFSDYQVKMNWTLQQFQNINKQRGVRYDLSIGAFDGDKLVGFIINGAGDWNNKPTVYDCGTGIIKEYRHKGIGTEILLRLIKLLRDAGITQYLLEVIKTNENAYQLYSKQGFEITREFDCVIAQIKEIKEIIEERNEDLQVINTDKNFEIIEINELNQPNWDIFKIFWDKTPSWQNSIDSIERNRDVLTILVVNHKTTPVGYAAFDPRNGGIAQFAIHPEYRRRKLGMALLNRIIETCPTATRLTIINIDKELGSFIGFYESLGLKIFVEQYEMMKKI